MGKSEHVQLILTICLDLFNYGLTSDQLPNQIGHQFQNLFNSIVEHDEKNSEIYRGILKDEMTKEDEAVDAMKDKLRFQRDRNSHQKKNFPKSESALVNKRETKRVNNRGTIKRNPPLPRALREPTTDGERTENVYFNCTDVPPNTNWTLGKVDVCGMSTKDLTYLCSTLLNLPQFKEYSLLPIGEFEDCKIYDIIVLHRIFITLYLHENVRKCATEEPLFVLNGHGNVSVFILGYAAPGIDVLQLLYYV